MTPIIITDPQHWDNALKNLSHPQTLQSWAWGDFKSRWGWRPVRLLWQSSAGTPVAAAQILCRDIPKTPWSMLYVSRGPMLDYNDLALVETVLQDLENYARDQKALFIKIDPAVPLKLDPPVEGHTPPGLSIQKTFAQRGWGYAQQQIQFKNTVLLDLTPSEDALLAAMKSKWRYNIRLAQRKGVVIRQGSQADLETFFQLYAVTSERDNFLIRPKAYYLDVWQQYLQNQKAQLFLASVEEEVIAGILLFYEQQTAWYMYGASINKHRKLMPNHLLQWEAIRAAKARGCTLYDLWGAPDVFDETDAMWGVYRFKLGFHGHTHIGLGAYDFPVQPLMYRLYNNLLPKLLSTWRRIRS
ncbi:MAG: peptidoglycan bridge formation glycyltransferase FemA/FemB family protein [Chloroflexota bacterium]